MRIAHFSDTFLPEVNGVSFALQGFIREQEKKHLVRVYAPAYAKGKLIEKMGKVEVSRYYSVPLPMYKFAQFTAPDLLDIFKSVNEFDPDIIHFHTPATLGVVGILIAKIMRVPLVGTYHTLFSELVEYVSVRKLLEKYLAAIDKVAAGMGLDLGLLRNGEQVKEDETGAQKITWSVVNRIYKYGDMIVCPSAAIMRELVKRNISKGKLVEVPNGLELAKYVPKNNYRLTNRLLHVGRLGYEKNVDVVIKAFARLVRAKGLEKMQLVIAGDGPAKKELEKLAGDLAIKHRVKFLGMVRRDKLPRMYREADIFVTASDMETQGLVVLEAMASGLPIMAVDKYAMCDLVAEGVNGFKVSPGDETGMAKKIMELLNNEKMREELGKKSREMSLDYGLPEVAQKLDRVYQSLIG